VHHQLSEQELLRLCLLNDPQAQFALYDRYVKAMYHVALRIVVHAAEAEEVLQDSFVKVFASLPRFRSESTIGAWIRRIVVTTALNHLRKRHKLTFENIQPHHDQEDVEYTEEPSWDAAALHHAIGQLPNGCRVVFTLYALEEMTHQDIAHTLRISLSTSKTQYKRAKHLLKTALQQIKVN
jgi:RNA polymerase sigma factor (sigma-70 family)